MKRITIILAALIWFRALGDTITISTNSAHYATTYSTPAPVVMGPTNADFTYYGYPTGLVGSAVYSMGISSSDAMSKMPLIHVAFDFTGTNFEFILDPFNTNGSYKTPYFTLSDGQTTTIYTNDPPFTQSGSANHWVPVQFGSNVTHHLTLVAAAGFAGVDSTNGTFAVTVPAVKPNLLLYIGDSYVEGYEPYTLLGYYGNGAVFWIPGFAHQLESLQSNLVTVEYGISGTGFYQTNGSTGDLPYIYNVTNAWGIYTNALASGLYSKIFVGVNGTINDYNDPTNAVYQNATNLLSLTKIHCPSATVFMVGNWMFPSDTSPNAADLALERAMTNAAAVEGWPIFDPIPANLRNAGNQSVFYPPGGLGDGIHPADAGYLIYASWLQTNLANTFGTNWTSPGMAGGGSSPGPATFYLPFRL